MEIIKSETLPSGSKVELVKKEEDCFEILLNGSIKATEYDISRAKETFSGIVHYYS